MTVGESRFDVVVPVFNSEGTLERTLRSVLSQTYALFQLYVIIDGATDGSAGVAYKVLQGHTNARILEQDNAGVAAARNRGASEGTGPFVAFLDADDEWLPNHLETLAGLIHSASADGLFATAYRHNCPGKEPVNVVYRGPRVQQRFPYFRASLSHFPPVWIGAVAISRSCFDAVGGLWVPPEDPHRCGEDIEFLMRVASRYPVAYVAEVTSVYHSNPQAGSGARYTPWGDPYVWRRGMELLQQNSLPESTVRDFARYVVRLGLHTVGARILKHQRRQALSLLLQCRPYHVDALRKAYWLAMLCLSPGARSCAAKWTRRT
jgi:glycosyltransferase involved in cell wall biosynthesis